jgi:hypothetical protein
MWKELDFADPENRVCRECEKLINRRQAEFNPVPELDDNGNEYDSIFLAALDVHASNLQLGG